jgi:sterol desaturase/sphingolipid hydroxylase (fatty acid hydroxylase superfamily)
MILQWSNSDLIAIFVFWGSLAILGALEVLIPAFQHSPDRLERWPTNLILGVVTMTIVPLAPVSALWGANWAYTQGIGLLNHVAHPWWIAVVVTLAVRSLSGYLDHVLMHKVPFLWRLHRVHHLDTHLDVSTSLRSHPAELATNIVTMVPAAIAFGLTPWVLMVYELADSIVGALSHANLRMPEFLDRRLRWVVVTPNMHCLHHSSYRPETDSNYGTVFTFWDRLFGTYCAAPRHGYDGLQIGLTEIRDQRTRNLWWQLKSPLIRIAAAEDGLAPSI